LIKDTVPIADFTSGGIFTFDRYPILIKIKSATTPIIGRARCHKCNGGDAGLLLVNVQSLKGEYESQSKCKNYYPFRRDFVVDGRGGMLL